MATKLSVQHQLSLNWSWEDTLDLGKIKDSSQYSKTLQYTDGTAAGQAQKIWHDQRDLAAGGNEELDLQALARTVFGDSAQVVFSAIKSLLIEVTNGTGPLRLGGAATNPWQGPLSSGGTLDVGSGDIFFQSNQNGWSVSATAKQLKLENLGSDQLTYRIILVGH